MVKILKTEDGVVHSFTYRAQISLWLLCWTLSLTVVLKMNPEFEFSFHFSVFSVCCEKSLSASWQNNCHAFHFLMFILFLKENPSLLLHYLFRFTSQFFQLVSNLFFKKRFPQTIFISCPSLFVSVRVHTGTDTSCAL